ncbi:MULTISPECIES: serine O-acetyltransferase [Rhodococcus]|uniref:serine O-acetyltransferase n=1 Tax=Rhodococcus TaxID=1827 RepID=UPI0009DBD8FD|nr:MULTISPECIES: hypothetical protein [Rhodococcus]PND53808.1 hypothetical protein CQZ88_01380 [Rhodococcus sp. ENV425]
MGMMEILVARRKSRWAREVLAVYGVEIPARVHIGKRFHLVHRGFGTVIHPDTIIGDDVQIYHQVTIGRADGHRPRSESAMQRVEIGDGAILFPGAKVLGGPGVTRVGDGTIVAANSVLTTSTGDNEVWAGVPARKVSDRK